uniref:SSD domain-containing protein n=1 Tax=Haemonchus placei TaxID=6290 RepID=A0A158QRJ1_HAEPC
LDEIERMEADLAANITFTMKPQWRNNDTMIMNDTVTFQDICMNWYGECYRHTNMITLLKRRHELEERGITVTYPQANTGGTPIYLAFNIGGVETFPNDTIKSVHAMRIWYFLRFDTPTLDAMAKEWEEAGAKYVREKYGDNPLIKCHIKHSRIVDQGLTNNANRLKPYFAVTVIVLIAFTSLYSMKWNIKADDGFSGIENRAFWAWCSKYEIECSKIQRQKRMVEAISESSVAIFITSITDVLSFGVGTFTDIIAVEGFCAMTSACMFFTWLYQVTFFAGLMVISAKVELAGRNSCLPCIKVSFEFQSTIYYYVPFLLDLRTKIGVAILFIAYLVISVYGISVMEQGLDYDKLLLQTDPLVEAFAREIELFPSGDQVSRHQKSSRHVYSNGPKSTSLWLREYLKYANLTGSFLNDDRESWVIGVYEWSQLFAFYKLWSQDFVWANTSDYDHLSLVSFRFRIGLHDLSTPTDLVMVTEEVRDLAAQHPDLEIFTYQYSRAIADQLNVILQSTIQNDSLAVICMIIISLLFIPNPLCAVWITIAIITIDVGVIGLLSLWSVKLDPIFMITIILSIGFSIEFSAHVTHGFVSNEDNLSPKERCIIAMEKLAWPVVHGSMSTILGVTVLAFINSYMVLVFFKTIFLVLTIGVFHALVLLPIVLAVTTPYVERLNSRLQRRSDEKKTKATTSKGSVYAVTVPVNVS